MKLSNTFQIDRPVQEVFEVFLDVERVATCMPGSRLTGKVDERTYQGEVKIKLGPLAVSYAGQATFLEIDEESRQLKLRAKATEQKGAGNADAFVVARVTEHDGGTQVVIDTDLTIRGKVAQFGRGAIGEVAGGLMQQFASNVEELLAGGGADSPAPVADSSSVAQSSDADEPVAAQPAISAWRVVVLPLVRKALPSVATVLASGLASYVGARAALSSRRRR